MDQVAKRQSQGEGQVERLGSNARSPFFTEEH